MSSEAEQAWIGLFKSDGREVSAPDYERQPLTRNGEQCALAEFKAASEWGTVRWWGVFVERTDCPPITTFELSHPYSICAGDRLQVSHLREKIWKT